LFSNVTVTLCCTERGPEEQLSVYVYVPRVETRGEKSCVFQPNELVAQPSLGAPPDGVQVSAYESHPSVNLALSKRSVPFAINSRLGSTYVSVAEAAVAVGPEPQETRYVTSPGVLWVAVVDPELGRPDRDNPPPLMAQGETFEVQVISAGRVVQTAKRGR